MAGVKVYGAKDWTTDLKHLIHRGMTVGEAAKELGMSRATAFRLLAEDKARR